MNPTNPSLHAPAHHAHAQSSPAAVFSESQPPEILPSISESNGGTGPQAAAASHHHRRFSSQLSDATQAVEDYASNVFCAGWTTTWTASQELKDHYPPRHSDFRDSLPESLENIHRLYSPYVKLGAWTFGLLEMWFPRAKAVKHSVHIPCWDSYKINPCRWKGVCLGRTVTQCLWTGLRQTRWTRAVYAAGLGHEYVYPVHGVGRHSYVSSLKALGWLYCCMGCLFGCGVGQVFSLCGNIGCNFAACYSCHARERLRRKYKLPPSFCMPPGIDDCLVHFFCFYCASHQEIRELVVRGVDGPGMHIFDVAPDAFMKLPGGPEAVAARKAVVDEMLKLGPRILRVREKKIKEVNARPDLERPSTLSSAGSSTSGEEALGWVQYTAPKEQEMTRVYGPSRKIIHQMSRSASF